MAILFLLNGPPGIGKLTLARMFTQHHPLALNLDVDRVRSLLGGWAQHPSEAGLLARELSLGMARTHLGGGRHVVVPQHLGRLTFIEQLEHTAGQTGADFGEVMLMDERTSGRTPSAGSRNAPRQTPRTSTDGRGSSWSEPVAGEIFWRCTTGCSSSWPSDRILAWSGARRGTWQARMPT